MLRTTADPSLLVESLLDLGQSFNAPFPSPLTDCLFSRRLGVAGRG